MVRYILQTHAHCGDHAGLHGKIVDMESTTGKQFGGLLRQRDFRNFWIADALSQLGNRITVLATPLLAITMLDASNFEVALLRTLETAAWLVFGLPVGAWCDRMRARRVMMVSDIARAVAFGTIPLAALFGVLSIWQLCVVAAAAGTLTVFFDVAHQTYLPRLIPRDDLIEGNARLQANTSVAAVVSPSIGGFIIQWFTAPVAILVNAVSFLWSAAWLRSIRSTETITPRTGKPRLRQEIREGLRLVFHHPLLRVMAVTGALQGLFQSAHLAVAVVFLARVIHLEPGAIGLLSSTGLVGAVLGAFVAQPLATRLGQARLLRIAALAFGGLFLLYPLTQPNWGLLTWAIAGFVTSWAVVVLNVVTISFQQSVCPDHLLSRVNATMKFLTWGAIPVGSVLGGALTAAVGLRGTLWVAAAGVLLSSVLLLLSPLRKMRELTDYPGATTGSATPERTSN
jgi:MFS family permease